MFAHTRSSAPKRFAKFGWQTRTFCHKKSGKSDCQTRVRQTIKNIYIYSLNFKLDTNVIGILFRVNTYS